MRYIVAESHTPHSLQVCCCCSPELPGRRNIATHISYCPKGNRHEEGWQMERLVVQEMVKHGMKVAGK